MRTEDIRDLLDKAIKAREMSYSPYSGFAVGAALLCEDGTVFTGANIENSSYTPTVCAERVAFFTAVHCGYQSFSAIAIVGGKVGNPLDKTCPPCGVCRQIMSEFCRGDFKIILGDEESHSVYTLDELLPKRFEFEK